MQDQVYWGSGSPYSWRALLLLEIKGAPYESKQIQFSKREHRSDDFLAMNPRGKVPVLKIAEGGEGITIRESLAILTYLDKKYPEPPLLGQSALETAKIWQTISELESYLTPVLAKFGRIFLFGNDEDKAKQLPALADEVLKELRVVEDTLSSSSYLVGEALSGADVVLFPHVMLLSRITSKEEFAAFGIDVNPVSEHFPGIQAWVKRIESIPGYERTYPPHWRES